jgi:hypothetical protein
MLNVTFRAEAIGAGAASRYGSGSSSTKMMRLLVAPASAPQHCFKMAVILYPSLPQSPKSVPHLAQAGVNLLMLMAMVAWNQ